MLDIADPNIFLFLYCDKKLDDYEQTIYFCSKFWIENLMCSYVHIPEDYIYRDYTYKNYIRLFERLMKDWNNWLS